MWAFSTVRLGLAGLCLVTVGALTAGLPGFWNEASAQQPNATGKRYAFLVGVEVYEHASLRELNYAGDDVAELGTALGKSGYEVTLLTAESGARDPQLLPTRANIESQLKEVLRRCKSQDLILLAFAGHGLQFAGSPDAHFCPIDARPFADETSSMVSMSTIYTELEKSFAGVKIMLVDACRDDPNPSRGRGIDADSAPPPPRGVAALFSCSSGQRAFESDELKHGVFFHHVLRGLEGEAANRAGDVTFDGLSAHVRSQVPVDVARLVPGQRQFPNLKADLIGIPPVLARVTIAPAVVPPPPAHNPPSIAPQAPEVTNSIGQKLVMIPAGAFNMGSTEVEIAKVPEEESLLPNAESQRLLRAETPQHKVTITRAFYMSCHEVTMGQFATVMGRKPKRFQPLVVVDDSNAAKVPDFGTLSPAAQQAYHEATARSATEFGIELNKANQGEVTARQKQFGISIVDTSVDNFPVGGVSWYDAIEFCNKLSEVHQLKPYYKITNANRPGAAESINSAIVTMTGGNGYRLPTEAEWEYSCRAGSTGPFHFGEEISSRSANVNGNLFNRRGLEPATAMNLGAPAPLKRPTAVGSYRANKFGLFDMHGNFAEWCFDQFHVDTYQHSRANDPVYDDPAGRLGPRVIRGGAWNVSSENARSASRRGATGGSPAEDVGFRVCFNP